MEQQELELIELHIATDPELKKLWEEHVMFEKILEKYASKTVLTPSEEMEMKEYKKKKLAGKTKIQELLKKYKRKE